MGNFLILSTISNPKEKVVFEPRPASAVTCYHSSQFATPTRTVKSFGTSNESAVSQVSFSDPSGSNIEGSTSLWRIIKSQQQQLNRVQRQVDEMFEVLKSQRQKQMYPQLMNVNEGDSFQSTTHPALISLYNRPCVDASRRYVEPVVRGPVECNPATVSAPARMEVPRMHKPLAMKPAMEADESDSDLDAAMAERVESLIRKYTI